MDTKLTTREVAELLGSTEPRLNHLIRSGRIIPPPSLRAGRRFWSPSEVSIAAKALGVGAAKGNDPAARPESAPVTAGSPDVAYEGTSDGSKGSPSDDQRHDGEEADHVA